MIIHNPILTGSFTVNGTDVASITSSAASITALNSYTASQNILNGTYTLTSSFAAQTASFTAFTSSVNAFSASILAQTASLNSFSASVLTFTGSASTRLGALEAATASLYTATSSLNASVASLNSYTQSTDAKIASIYSTTSSLNTRVGTLEAYTSSLNDKTSSFATTGSNNFIGTQTITGSVLQSGSFTSTGTLTAQTLVVQTITSSVVYSSGSNIFGNAIGNTQTFTGSVLVTGSLTISTGGNASAPTIFGSTIACSPIGCFATSCATSFIGGTMSGTTIYGSTAVCSPVGKFTSCIDAGSGTFSGIVAINGATNSGGLSVKTVSSVGLNIQGTAASALMTFTPVSYDEYRIGAGDVNVNDFGIRNATRAVTYLSFSGGASGGAATFSSNITLSSTSAAPSYGSGSVGVNLGYLNLQNVVNLQGSYANNIYYNGTNWIGITNCISKANAVRLIQDGAIGFHIGTVTTPGQIMSTWDTTDIKMYINCSGNVGIGSVSPSSNINPTAASILTLRNTTTFPSLVLQGATCSEGGYTLADELYIDVAGSTTACKNAIIFRTSNTNSSYTTTERMRITSAGNIGIGTDAPGYKLHVNGTSRFISCALGSHIFGNPNVCNDGTVIIGTVVNGTALSLTDGAAAHTYFKFNTACGSVIESDSKLTFITAGSISSLMLAGSTGIACFGYTVCAPCFATISDYRMKSNVRPIEGLSIIMNTKPYKFEYNYDCSTSFGMIAHELQDTLPEAVFGEKDGEVMQGVDYMKLLPIAIKAIQEQQCKIALLESCLGIT